jgi:DNA polymerase I-like protein with 3'-5' exonuclease and polymerase domains
MLGPFRSKSSRNQPSNTKFIFGPATWIRGLIKPERGWALAYVDWRQQEFGIAARLSGDEAMMDAYRSGDPYLAFGKQCGRIPADGTEEDYETERNLFKACVLGVQYGMGRKTLAQRIDQSPAHARELLQLHRRTYPRFWRWSDSAVAYAMLKNRLSTVFGWTIRVGANANPRSLRNYPCQANGAEMLRLACSLATERGIRVLAPVHDALLVGGPIDTIGEVVAQTQAAMAEASEIVLSGFRLRSDAKIVSWPDRYMDKRGREFWNRVMALLPPADPDSGTDGAWKLVVG